MLFGGLILGVLGRAGASSRVTPLGTARGALIYTMCMRSYVHACMRMCMCTYACMHLSTCGPHVRALARGCACVQQTAYLHTVSFALAFALALALALLYLSLSLAVSPSYQPPLFSPFHWHTHTHTHTHTPLLLTSSRTLTLSYGRTQ